MERNRMSLMHTQRRSRLTTVTGLLLAGAFALTACSSGSGGGTSTPEATGDPSTPEVTDVTLTGIKGPGTIPLQLAADERSEEHTSELQSLMRISYAVFCLKKKKQN